MEEPRVTLIHHRACSECQLVREALEKQKVAYRARDIYDAPLRHEELEVLLEGVDPTQFLNPRATEYRDRNMKERPPTLEMAVELMARDPRLLRCPILVKGDETFPVNIATDAAVLPPELWKFLGIEVAAKKATAGGHAKAASGAKAQAAASATPAAPKHSETKDAPGNTPPPQAPASPAPP